MKKRIPLIAGNWKMNGLRDDAKKRASAVAKFYQTQDMSKYELLICPPYTVMETVKNAIAESGVLMGAQRCHVAENGAHTGDISPNMLTDIGCSHVIVGHSERRMDHGETDIDVQMQAQSAHKNGLIAIICVGETQTERENGDALSVVKSQIRNSVPQNATAKNTVIAYEPVWAIGTGKVATANDVQEMHKDIRQILADLLGPETGESMRILYGGSMKANNAEELLKLIDVDGGLIGGASLNSDDFAQIAQIAQSC